MKRQHFDDIFHQLTFGTRSTSKPSVEEKKLPLRVLPAEAPSTGKCRKIHSNKENVETKKIKLFANSTAAIDLNDNVEKPEEKEATHEEKIAKIRQLNQIYTWGSDVPDLFIDFKDLHLPKQLSKNIKKAEFTEPTPIQMQAVPIMLEERNLLANAPTGSGKTLAYILPIVQLLLRNLKNKQQSNSVNAVILSPTNVLSQQIYTQFQRFLEGLPIKVALLEPGTPIEAANVLVTTPHKFIFSLKKQNLTPNDLSHQRWLILDEADRLFETTEGDRNFRLQFDEIYKACDGPKLRLAFFSATFSFELEGWCKKHLEMPAMLCIGHRNSANISVKQKLVFSSDENGKLFALEQILTSGFEPPALVFLQSKDRAGSLFVELQARFPKMPMRLISSELTNDARDKILEKFRNGQIWILISTEMLGRGLDLPNVNLVVNFDLPNSIVSYIHRVGRTGRAGRVGQAVTFFSYNDLSIIRPIATVISQAGFPVPEYTLKLEKLTRNQRKWLLRHAPHRRNVGSIGRWTRVKKAAMKSRIVKRDPKLLRKKKPKKKAKAADDGAQEKTAADSPVVAKKRK